MQQVEYIDIVRSFRQGDHQAFRKLYDLYYPKLYQHVTNIVKSAPISEDIVHDTFVVLWEKRKDINESLSLQSYLFTIARNKLFQLIKKASKESEITDKIIDAAIHCKMTDEDYLVKETENEINNAIDRLPPKRRQIFKLHSEQGLTYDEIANQLGLSRGTINTQMMRSLKSVKDYLYFQGIL
jgi:RNA polymerase sigma-70 factor (family 1)